MRPIERALVLLILMTIPSTVVLHAFPLWYKALVFAAALLVPLHAWFEGPHWQMASAYVAAFLLPVTLTSFAQGLGFRWTVAIVAALLLLASIAFSFALPMFKLPKPSGPFPVGTRMLYLIDPTRKEMHPWASPGKREVVVQLWYPSAVAKGRKAAYRRWKECSLLSSYQSVLQTHSLQDSPVAPGRFPILIYNPGWHGFRNRSACITQELASQGFIVVGISHPYNSSKVELSHGGIAVCDKSFDIGFSMNHYIPLQERLDMAELELGIQVDDCRFVLTELARLDQTPGNPLASHLLIDRVAAYGDSYGAAVSAELAKTDARVCSALALDGVLHGSVAKDGLDKPFMMIDSAWILSVRGHDGDPLPQRSEETTRMWNSIAESKASTLARHGGFRTVVQGTNHANFSDVGFMSPLRKLSETGPLPQKRTAQIITAYAVAFFGQTLLGKASPLLSGALSFPEAPLEVWPGTALKSRMAMVSQAL